MVDSFSLNQMVTAICVYNRLRISRLCLEQMTSLKEGGELWIFDDHSDASVFRELCVFGDRYFRVGAGDFAAEQNRDIRGLSLSDLQSWGSVGSGLGMGPFQKNPYGWGINLLRWFSLEIFEATAEFGFMYMTDNDVIHDPNFMTQLGRVYDSYSLPDGRRLPVTLFNSEYHSKPEHKIAEDSEVVFRRLAPGVSMLLDREMISELNRWRRHSLASGVLTLQQLRDTSFEYLFAHVLRRPFVHTKTSFLEHFGADRDSLHSEQWNWERDRAVCPTKCLREIREPIISYLSNESLPQVTI